MNAFHPPVRVAHPEGEGDLFVLVLVTPDASLSCYDCDLAPVAAIVVSDPGLHAPTDDRHLLCADCLALAFPSVAS